MSTRGSICRARASRKMTAALGFWTSSFSSCAWLIPSSSLSPRIFFPNDTPNASLREGLRNADSGRSEDDEHEGRENEQHEREKHLDRRLVRGLLGPLPALHAKLVGLYTQHLRDADTQLLGLNDGVDERGQLLDADALFEFRHRLSAHLAHRDVAQHARQLLGQRPATLLRHAGETGFHAGRDQVHRVWHGADHHLLAGLDLALKPDAGKDPAEGGKHNDEDQLLNEEAAGKDDEHDEAQSREYREQHAPEGKVALERHRVA